MAAKGTARSTKPARIKVKGTITLQEGMTLEQITHAVGEVRDALAKHGEFEATVQIPRGQYAI